MTRRTALKTLLATTGGIAAALLLPSEWVKPIVTSGVLPVHAASSVKFVKGIIDYPNALAGVSFNNEFSAQNGHPLLGHTASHAKHAAPARGFKLDYPAAGVPVTLYQSVDQFTSRTKFNEAEQTNPHLTDSDGFTDNWDISGYDGMWHHFVISGNEDSVIVES